MCIRDSWIAVYARLCKHILRCGDRLVDDRCASRAVHIAVVLRAGRSGSLLAVASIRLRGLLNLCRRVDTRLQGIVCTDNLFRGRVRFCNNCLRGLDSSCLLYTSYSGSCPVPAQGQYRCFHPPGSHATRRGPPLKKRPPWKSPSLYRRG